MAPLASCLECREISSLNLEGFTELIVDLGFEINETAMNEVEILLRLFSERYGRTRHFLQTYLRRYGRQLTQANILTLMDTLNPNCIADKDALANTPENRARSRGKRARQTTRRTNLPSSPAQ
jgi:hypothetical protein